MTYSLKLLYSGSDGNAALLTLGDHAVLIDAGRNCKTLCAALLEAGVSPDAIDAIFLTHEHRDHTAALEVFLKHHPCPVHAAGRSAEVLQARACAPLCELLVAHPPLFQQTVGPFTFCSFRAPHDSQECVGYRITLTDEQGVHTIGYATDLGNVTKTVEEGLMGCEAVVLECNHDEQMLMTGPYPYDLKRRIASRYGHLSNSDCAAFSTRLVQNGTKRLLLAHLSETNNLPDLALNEVRSALCGMPVRVRAADPVHITEL